MNDFHPKLQTVSSYWPVNVHWCTWALPINLLDGYGSKDRHKTVNNTQFVTLLFVSLENYHLVAAHIDALIQLDYTTVT